MNSVMMGAIFKESNFQETSSWWMSKADSNEQFRYPTPMGYQQIQNAQKNDKYIEKEMILSSSEQHNDIDYHYYPTPKGIENKELEVAAINENKELIQSELSSHHGEPRKLDHELQLIYRKLLMSSLIVFILCLITLIGTFVFFIKNKPNSKPKSIIKSLIFNIILLINACFGIFCSVYNERKYSNKSLKKLKWLLFYFILCSILSFLLLCLQMVYMIFIPITYYHKIKLPICIGLTVFYFAGIVFWMILIMFYIDLVARACLKRGRIGFIIIQFSGGGGGVDSGDREYKGGDEFSNLQSTSFWVQTFSLIIWFRGHFRYVRRLLSHMTGIRLVDHKPVLNIKYSLHSKEFDGNHVLNDMTASKVSKEHEEDKIKNMLQEGANHIVYGPKFSFFSRKREVNDELDDFNEENNDNDDDDDVCENDEKGYYNNGACLLLLKCVCLLVICYLFFPILILLLCVTFFSVLTTCVNCDDAKCIKTTYHVIAMIIGFVCWVYVWWWKICKNESFGTNLKHNFDWNVQCAMWDNSMFVFVTSIIKSMTSPLANNV